MLLMSQNQKTQSLQRKVFTEIGVTDCILFILLNNPLPVVWLISRSCVYDQFYFVLDLDENLGSIRFPLDECETPHFDEETIKARFVAAFNAILDSKGTILEDCRLMQSTLTDCTGIDKEIQTLLEEIEVVTELTKRCIAENSQTAQNQEEYAARYNGFVERYEKAKVQLEQLRTTKAARENQAKAIGAFMFEVQELGILIEFDEKLWLTVIDTVTVHADGRMTFKFQGGTEIEG